MIKDEDAGTFYFDQAGPGLRLPDFRVVRRDGEHLLVEVKNVSPAKVIRTGTGPPAPRVQRLRSADVEAQRRYAQLTGARLVFAHYWGGINLWTVVDSHVLRRKGKHFELDLGTAMKANEFGLLGDRVVSTTARLVLSLFADPDAPRVPLADSDGPSVPVDVADGEEGVPFVVGKVEFSCDGKSLTDPIERRIAQYLFFFGSGETTMQAELDDERRPIRVDLIWSSPAGPESPMVGSHLSSMYSARYILATKQPEGTVTRFGHPPDPRLTRLIPSDYWDTDRRLHLWVFYQQPNTEETLSPTDEGPRPATQQA